MAKQNIDAELGSRPGDEVLDGAEVASMSIFRGLKPEKLDLFPGSVVLRRYRKGEVICRQGAAGWTAFYIPTTADLLSLREHQGLSDHDEEILALRDRLSRLSPYVENDQILAAGEHKKLLDLDPADKRARAEQWKAGNPELARRLKLSAEGQERIAKATVYLLLPRRKSASERRSSGSWFRRLFGSGSSAMESDPGPTWIPIDGPIDLRRDKPVDTMQEGEVFGEMSCLNRSPRSAWVVAKTDCLLVEMLRNIFGQLYDTPEFKKRTEETYRRRVLKSHLRALPIFRDVDDDFLLDLAGKHVESVTKKPGEILFKENDPADCLYLIRQGLVRVYRQTSRGLHVLAYRGRGEYVGEIGLLREVPRTATCEAFSHPDISKNVREASRVELIRIDRSGFEKLLNKYPAVREQVEKVAEERRPLKPAPEPKAEPLSRAARFDESGFAQGQRLMLINLDRCTRCDECVRACAATHDDGRSRLFREGERFGNFLVPSSCRMCLDPVCMIGCPVGSIHKGGTGEIVIEDWCIGCSICANNCPYESIMMHPLLVSEEQEQQAIQEAAEAAGKEVKLVAQRAVVCDQCSSIPGQAGRKESCVYACPHDAAMRVDGLAFFASQMEGAWQGRRMVAEDSAPASRSSK